MKNTKLIADSIKKNMTTTITSVYNVTLNYVIKYYCYAKYYQYQNK